MTQKEWIIQVLESHLLSSKQRTDIATLCSLVYEEDFESTLSTYIDPTHILAFSDGTLVGHALWVTRWLEYNHSLMLRTAYVEAVATHPGFRNRGIGTAVMRALQAKIQDYDIGALSPSDVRWYARLGWERWQGPLFIRKEGKLLTTPGEDVMILRLPRTPNLDLKVPLTAEWRQGELW